MKASVWCAGLPESLVQAQEEIVRAALDRDMRLSVEWVGVPVQHGSHSGYFCVGSDALRVGEPGDAVRVCVDYLRAQTLCDLLGLQMPTPKMVDLVWKHAQKRVNPCTFAPDAQSNVQCMDPDTSRMVHVSMSSVVAMRAHSLRVDGFLSGSDGLVCNVGKWWTISRGLVGQPSKPGVYAENYGWFTPAAKGLSVTGVCNMYQSVGHAHNLAHTDYSQVFVPVGAWMIVDDTMMAVADVLQSPELAPLLSHEGVLACNRHPLVPPCLPDDRYCPISPPPGEATLVATVPVAATPTPTPTPPATLERAYAFTQAKNFTRVTGAPRTIDLILLHTTEAAEKPTTAEAVAAWFAGPQAPKASAHFVIDQDSIVQCVDEQDCAWGAPGTNHNGLHLEHAGYAKQTLADWHDAASTAMLERSARLCGKLCRRHVLPVQFVDAEGLLVGKRGITTHAEVSRACRLAKERSLTTSPFFFAKTDHTDPGPNFPLDEYLGLVRKAMEDM